MEEKQAENVEQQPAKKERPTFLTVLCILSFIGVGFVVISNIVALIGGGVSKAILETSEEVMEAMETVEEVPVVGESVSKIVSNASTMAPINIIAALVVLVGVLMMWRLKKTGYYIYIVGEIAPVIALIVLGGLLGGFMAIFSSLIAILFIVLYGLNVKHMA